MFYPAHAKRYIITLFLLLPLSLPCYAQTTQASIDEILQATGINKLITASPKLALAALKQSAFAIEDPQVSSRLNGAYSSAFTEEKIRQSITSQLQQTMPQLLADNYLWLLADPVWQKLSKMERASSNPQNAQDMIAFAEANKLQPAPADRIALIERLDQANRTSEFSVNLKLAFFRSVFSAINPVMDADMKIDDEELIKMQEEVRKSITDDINKHVQLSYLYAFRNVDNAELESYIELNESDTNRDSNQQLTKAIINAIDQSAYAAARAMEKSN